MSNYTYSTSDAAIKDSGAFRVVTNETGEEFIEILASQEPFNEYTDESGDKIFGSLEQHTINSPESTKEMEESLLGLKPINVLQVNHWLDNLEPIENRGLSFVGYGIESKVGIKIEIGLSQNLKSHVQNDHWRENTVCFLVGEYTEPMFGNTHWVAISNGIWPAADITENTAKGVWVQKRTRFSFTLTQDFVVKHRRSTKKGNQKLTLLVTFGRGPVAGNSIWVNPHKF